MCGRVYFSIVFEGSPVKYFHNRRGNRFSFQSASLFAVCSSSYPIGFNFADNVLLDKMESNQENNCNVFNRWIYGSNVLVRTFANWWRLRLDGLAGLFQLYHPKFVGATHRIFFHYFSNITFENCKRMYLFAVIRRNHFFTVIRENNGCNLICCFYCFDILKSIR